jgi:hypothetical protein
MLSAGMVDKLYLGYSKVLSSIFRHHLYTYMSGVILFAVLICNPGKDYARGCRRT